MMVTRVRFVHTGRRNPHAGQAELHLERIGDGIAILRANDIDRGIGRGRGLSQRHAKAGDYQDDEKRGPAESWNKHISVLPVAARLFAALFYQKR
jgi:hypothetical protein